MVMCFEECRNQRHSPLHSLEPRSFHHQGSKRRPQRSPLLIPIHRPRLPSHLLMTLHTANPEFPTWTLILTVHIHIHIRLPYPVSSISMTTYTTYNAISSSSSSSTPSSRPPLCASSIELRSGWGDGCGRGRTSGSRTSMRGCPSLKWFGRELSILQPRKKRNFEDKVRRRKYVDLDLYQPWLPLLNWHVVRNFVL